ncbi:MAG: serine/threonine-protein kinase [Proteobacteria bacterium]|nr:serine/threonine-protein kinase [Pseudomonadota bacterium]
MRQPVPFGKYLLLDRISVGGMAEVFKAKSYGVEGFEKIIAIKRILPTMGEDRDFIKMFIDEAKIAGQLAHANICQIFELGRIDGSHFIAMEYIWGKDLLQIQNRLKKLKKPMPVAMGCFVIAKVLEGLDYAHRKRDPLGRPLEIVHRDCSPQNVLVSYEGEVKVIDFGIAKATSRNSRTMAGVLKGKFGYMSPEQVRGLPLDRRSDIFAIGTMLFECLTSERLFHGETDFSTLEKVRNVDIQSPRAVNPAIPEAIERIILKALAKDVEARYQWCSEMLTDLQQFLMTQDQVFTAKSLSGWLKDVFTPEIDKERGLLEQYKRVGRDGLIAGVPAAEAKLDVVEHLGEAPQIAESDATQLGGPDFDDMESGIGASPEVGPALGSPAARGGGAIAASPPARAKPPDDDRDGDFGEEAPTEIFGEIEHGSALPPAAAPRPAPAAPSFLQKPTPPKAPGRPATQGSPALRSPSTAPPPQVAAPAAPIVAPQIQIGDGPPQALGLPNTPAGAQARTLMGQLAPAGLPNYANGYPPQVRAQPNAFDAGASNPSNQANPSHSPPPSYQYDPQTGQPMMVQQVPHATPPPSQPYYQQQPPPPQPQHSQQYPQQSGPYQAQYPSGANQGGYQYPQNGFAHGSGSAGPQPYGNVAPAVEPKVEGRRKSSLGRDIAIGVLIALVVLGGFLAVKFLILDKRGEEPAGTSAIASKMGTLQISLPGDVSAKLFIDGKEIGTYADKSSTTVNEGTHKVRLERGAEKCERELKLEGGKSVVFDCVMLASGSDGSATPAVGSGSAAKPETAGSGSALAPSVGSGSAITSGSGSDAKIAKVDPPKVDPPKLDPLKLDPPKVDPKKDPVKVDPPKLDPKKVDPKDPKKVDPPKVDPPKLDPKKDPKKDPTKDKLPFEDKKPPTPTDKGFLDVSSNKKAKILVDGVDTGLSTPISGKALPLTPGKHKITFVVGEDRFTFPVTIKVGATETMRKELQ